MKGDSEHIKLILKTYQQIFDEGKRRLVKKSPVSLKTELESLKGQYLILQQELLKQQQHVLSLNKELDSHKHHIQSMQDEFLKALNQIKGAEPNSKIS